MHKALTPVNSSENDFFADDAVEEAEETAAEHGMEISSNSIKNGTSSNT